MPLLEAEKRVLACLLCFCAVIFGGWLVLSPLGGAADTHQLETMFLELEEELEEAQSDLREARAEASSLREALRRAGVKPSPALSANSSSFYGARRSSQPASQPHAQPKAGTAVSTPAPLEKVRDPCAGRPGATARGSGPRPIPGGDLEASGVLEAAFAARAVDGELIFLSVGDTRDHRRVAKDPALKDISTEFLLHLLANLRALGRENWLILSTRRLCGRLQAEHCERSCVWSTLWDDHPGLEPWRLKPGDMFLMWAQQWRYVARALELGYRVFRADTDVYFAEDPYPLLRSPLLRPFEMVVQHDFASMLDNNRRPACSAPPRRPADSAVAPGLQTCGTRPRNLALLNIGLLYVRSSPGGGAYAAINETWAAFLSKLSGPPYKPKHLNGRVESQALIDQPFMRKAVDELAAADPASLPPKPASHWAVVSGASAPPYPAGATCSLADKGGCGAVLEARRKTAFLVQLVRPRRPLAGVRRDERVALAPDWLFGRGCLTHVRRPLSLLRAALPSWGAQDEQQRASCTPTAAQPAPGAAAGVLVATHFVYSMAVKRQRAFAAFGWSLGDARNRSRSAADDDPCWRRSDTAILFGHTFFEQSPSKTVLCAMPKDGAPACSCCRSLPSLAAKDSALREKARAGGFVLESSNQHRIRVDGHFSAMEGCNDYQRFWDRR